MEQWYAATFHLAWLLIARPDDADAYARLHAAHASWLALRTADRSAQSPALPAPPGEEHLFSLPIRQALKLPKGTGPALRPLPKLEQPGA